MAVLIIGAIERRRIAEIVAHAKAHPVLFDLVRQGVVDDTDVLQLRDRKPGTVRPVSEGIIFPGGYRAAFSIEQQPAGFCSHLSVSTDGRGRRGVLPAPEAVAAIAAAFGMTLPADKLWNEEYEPGEYAVNLVSLLGETKGGSA